MTVITITQSLYYSLKRTLEFVDSFPGDCQITIILGIQTLESFFNELTVLNKFIEDSELTSEIETLCDLLSEIEESKGSLKLKVLNTDFILNGSNNIKGTVLYENLNLLIALRNHIVHPRPTIFTEEKSISENKLFKSFMNKKLIDNYDTNNPIMRSMTYYLMNKKVAEWCITTVKDIINYFIESFNNKAAKIALGAVKLSMLEPNELKSFISTLDEGKKSK